MKIDDKGLIELKPGTYKPPRMVMFTETLLSLLGDFVEAWEDGPNNR